MQSDMGAITLPSPSHIGVIVKDWDKTAQFYKEMWGAGPFDSYEGTEYHRDKFNSPEELGSGEPIKIREGQAKFGTGEIELIQPLEGRSIYSMFLDSKGEGLHHIAYVVPNWAEVVDRLLKHGGRLIHGGVWRGRRWCYFETNPGNMIMEFMEAEV